MLIRVAHYIINVDKIAFAAMTENNRLDIIMDGDGGPISIYGALARATWEFLKECDAPQHVIEAKESHADTPVDGSHAG